MKTYRLNFNGRILAFGVAFLLTAGGAMAQTTTATLTAKPAAPAVAKEAPPSRPAVPDLPKNGEEVLENWGNSTNSDELQLKLNFRGASLDSVLEYLSKAAGFIIVRDAVVDGTIDAWSHQPLSRDEAVELLNTILNDKGYAAIRPGRILRIVSKGDAKMFDLPVETESDPEKIPRSDKMVTQIIPIRYAAAMKLMDNLRPLLAEHAVISANEDSNAIVLTDTQTNIRRMARIIKALDTSISSISDIQVFPLQYADAEELSKVVEEIFEMPTSSGRSSDRSRMEAFMRMRSGGDDRGRGDSGQRGTGNSQAQSASTRVSAVADARSNSLVVSAPGELMPEIEELVALLDTSATDFTEIRVFNLKYADAEELANLVSEVFGDDQRSSGRGGSSSSRFGDFMAMRFGGGGPGGGRPGGGRPGGSRGGDDRGERRLAEAQVVAVADTRTNSLIVTASPDMMEQVKQMVEHLDSNPAMKQKVYVHDIQHADVEALRDILSNMFYGGTGSSSSRYGSSSRPSSSSRYPSSSSRPSSSRTSSSGFGSSSSSQRR